jgi:hypothetical protein
MCAESEAPARIGRVLAALLLTAAFFQSCHAWAGSRGGGGFHGGGHHAGAGGFHGGGHHAGAGGFHAHRFHGGGFHAHRFHGGAFHHHGFRRGGFVVVPAFGLWWGGGLGWPYYSYPYDSYYGQGPYTRYWYCENPPGYYPSVTQCNTGWQLVPAN